MHLNSTRSAQNHIVHKGSIHLHMAILLRVVNLKGLEGNCIMGDHLALIWVVV
jgi:hypothetical protein